MQLKSSTGKIKVCVLAYKYAKQGCPRHSLIMFYKISGMLRCIQQNKQSRNSAIIGAYQKNHPEPDSCNIATLVMYKPPETIRVKQDITREDATKNVTQLMMLLDNLDLIQTRASHIWSCNKIGLDPNGNLNKIVCT